MESDWCARRLFRPDVCFWEPPIGNEVDEFIFFYFFFIFPPLFPLIVLVPVLIKKGSQKEGQVLKEFHEIPEGKAILASGNFTEHQRRNVLDKNSFTKSQRGNRFWPASVSRNNKERNVLDDDSFMKSPRGKRFWQFYEIPEGNTVLTDVRREHEQQRPHPQESEERENIFKMCGYLLQFPFYTPLFVFEYFIFCDYLCEGWERELLKFSAPFGFWEGRVF